METTEKKLSLRERLACLTVCLLKWNENEEFYECDWNNSVMTVASKLLKGQDPVAFMLWLHDDDPANYSYLGISLAPYKPMIKGQ
jgi:hypothetical protein